MRYPLKLLVTLSALTLLGSPLRAEIGEELQQMIIAALKGAETPEQLEKSLVTIKEEGATAQQLLETKIIFVTKKTGDPKYFAKFRPEIDKLKGSWKEDEGIMYKTTAELEAVCELMDAKEALRKEDSEALEKHVKQAFWLNHGMAEDLGEIIDKYKQMQTRIMMDTKVNRTDGTQVTLAQLAEGQKALYIQVWATWCQPCIALFPALKHRSKALPPQGLPVVAVNFEMGQEGRSGGFPAKAKLMRGEHEMQDVPWLIESDKAPLCGPLEINSVPRAIVLSPEGKVLFNGHPLDNELVAVLNGLDVELDIHGGLPKDDGGN